MPHELVKTQWPTATTSDSTGKGSKKGTRPKCQQKHQVVAVFDSLQGPKGEMFAIAQEPTLMYELLMRPRVLWSGYGHRIFWVP